MSRAVMQTALDALETISVDVKTTPTAYEAQRQAMKTLREALAQPEHDPYVDPIPTDSLINALAEIRDVFPTPERGEYGEHEWAAAIGDPLSVPAYVKTMLAQPEQEPKCSVIIEVFGKDWRLDYMSLPVGKHKLYTQQYTYTAPPPAQPAKPLTDEEIDELAKDYGLDHVTIHPFARAIEAAHGIKENT